jgi:antitoxin CcdA
MRMIDGDARMLRFDNAPKRPTNLSLNAKVLDAARALGMNLSATVDALLAEEVRRRCGEKWNAENGEAIAAYNARIEREGTLSQRIHQRAERSGDSSAA